MVKEQSTLIKAGQYTLDFAHKTLIMGILNVTPDSFSDGGKYNHVENAVHHARQMMEDGADILDIGGESTRPGYERISDSEEISRVVPAIEAITKELQIPISIDTYKSEVAKKAVDAGAVIINDIWGAKADPEIADVAAETGVPIILMHNRHDRNYTSFIRDVLNDLYESITIAKKAGVKDERRDHHVHFHYGGGSGRCGVGPQDLAYSSSHSPAAGRSPSHRNSTYLRGSAAHRAPFQGRRAKTCPGSIRETPSYRATCFCRHCGDLRASGRFENQ